MECFIWMKPKWVSSQALCKHSPWRTHHFEPKRMERRPTTWVCSKWECRGCWASWESTQELTSPWRDRVSGKNARRTHRTDKWLKAYKFINKIKKKRHTKRDWIRSGVNLRAFLGSNSATESKETLSQLFFSAGGCENGRRPINSFAWACHSTTSVQPVLLAVQASRTCLQAGCCRSKVCVNGPECWSSILSRSACLLPAMEGLKFYPVAPLLSVGSQT